MITDTLVELRLANKHNTTVPLLENNTFNITVDFSNDITMITGENVVMKNIIINSVLLTGRNNLHGRERSATEKILAKELMQNLVLYARYKSNACRVWNLAYQDLYSYSNFFSLGMEQIYSNKLLSTSNTLMAEHSGILLLSSTFFELFLQGKVSTQTFTVVKQLEYTKTLFDENPSKSSPATTDVYHRWADFFNKTINASVIMEYVEDCEKIALGKLIFRILPDIFDNKKENIESFINGIMKISSDIPVIISGLSNDIIELFVERRTEDKKMSCVICNEDCTVNNLKI